MPCRPFLRPGQQVLLIIGDQQAAPQPVYRGNQFAFLYLSQPATDQWRCAAAAARGWHRQPHHQHDFDAARVHRTDREGDVMRNPNANPSGSWSEQNQAYLSAQFARLWHRLSAEHADAAKAAELDRIADELLPG